MKRFKKTLTPYILLFPAFLLVFGILGYAVFSGIVMSFFRVNALYLDKPFVGFQNYVRLFTDKVFVNAIRTSLIFVGASVLLGMLLSFTFALTVYKVKKYSNFYKAIILIPYLVSGIATAIIWRFLFSGDAGFINLALQGLGVETFTWLGHSGRALFVIIIANTWFITPFSVLIILAGLQGIDPQLYEAGRIDGASRTVIFFSITVPLIKPMIGVSLVWLSFASFNMFDIILPLTGGGPGRATEVLAVYMYNKAFSQLNYSLGSAVMVILLVINITTSAVIMKFTQRAG
jgi:multiple sugar transport system permease protein